VGRGGEGSQFGQLVRMYKGVVPQKNLDMGDIWNV
jgi:hypothetical protein